MICPHCENKDHVQRSTFGKLFLANLDNQSMSKLTAFKCLVCGREWYILRATEVQDEGKTS